MEKMTIRKRLADCFLALAKRLEKKDDKPFVEVNVKVWGDDVKVSFTRDEINEIYGKALKSATSHGVQ